MNPGSRVMLPGDLPEPEQSRVFCIAAWTHLHVIPTGGVFPCCMSAHDPANAIGNLRTGDSLESAWNSEPMRALRLRMLSEQPSQLCERCYAIEALGQVSWRQTENREMAAHLSTVTLTTVDGRVEQFHVPYLDIRPSNVCNLACRICTPSLSSAWHRDAVRLGELDRGAPAIISATVEPRALLDQVLPLLDTIERFHFAGGEPLLSDEHYEILASLVARDRFDVRLSYNTNLSRLTYRGHDVLGMWQRFARVYVQASLDGMGPRGEYMRSGQRWSEVEANRARMLDECPHVEFRVLATVSVFNALHLPDFYREWVERGLMGPGDLQLNILFEPEYYNIQGLSPHLKDKVRRAYKPVIAALSRMGSEVDETRGHFEAVLTYMEAQDRDIVEMFQRRTADLDGLRGESLVDVFPELAGLLSLSPAHDLMASAQAYRRLGKMRSAIDDLNELIGLNPPSGDAGVEWASLLRDAYVLRARLCRRIGEHNLAAQDLGEAVRYVAVLRTASSASVVGVSGLAQTGGTGMNDTRKSPTHANKATPLADLVRAVQEDPDRAICELDARVLEWQGAMELVPDAPVVDEALTGNPALAFYLRAIAKLAGGDATGARADLERVLALRPLLTAAEEALGVGPED